MLSRRNFLKFGLGAAAGLGMSVTPSGKLIASVSSNEKNGRVGMKPSMYETDTRWAFLIDANKCVGCGLCVRACKLENEIPYDISPSRTWVERYIVKKDMTVIADSPMAARDGYIRNDPQGVAVHESEIAKALFIPKLCNQCEKPACVQVCPVGATYQTADGIVLVDRSWCIGCGYCIMACPYGVRFFHPVHKTAEKCNWCYHRITRGMKPACVEACPFGVRNIGNYMDINDPVTRIIRTERVNVLKDSYGTSPMAFYLGLDEVVR